MSKPTTPMTREEWELIQQSLSDMEREQRPRPSWLMRVVRWVFTGEARA